MLPHLSDLIAAVALFLVLEGMAPFVNPRGMKRALLYDCSRAAIAGCASRA